ncbi:Pre-mRNA splicing Prp18-interacting factor-domain-containing protein [Syncephalis plumigaleata]|nr:Pre-mRNA splicing Prp18-interacting factor-domain-containing protein [Syncephalis plumigaleata]
MASASGSKLSREEYRRLKDLDAARKAGNAPAEVDEEGNEINPHIPQYISKAPWYLDVGHPTLKHQRPAEEKASIDNSWYNRGQAKGKAATKYRKGACENCGAITHKSRDCVERPRTKGAKWTGKNIKADEVIQEVSLDFEGKRDRWNGYNADDQLKLIEKFEKIEEERKKRKAEELEQATENMSADVATKMAKSSKVEGLAGYDSEDDSDGDGDKYADQADMAGQRFDQKTRATVRNLRIREDTAKYLMNLDPDSAYYDPKTRSMRDNPNRNRDNALYQGDNAIRYSGDASKVAKLQLFAWQAQERGAGTHLQANPTQGELLHRQFEDKKGELQDTTREKILERYGGVEHLNAPPKELLLAQSENYVEYSRSGQVIRGQEKAVPRSKYQEDVFTNSHTTVWGSFWEDGQWGYKCCRSFHKNAYCTAVAN